MRSAARLEKALWKVHRNEPVDIVQAASYLSPGYTLRQNPHVPFVCRISSYTPLIRAADGYRRAFSDYLCDWLEIRQIMDADASFAPSEFMAKALARVEGRRPQVIRTQANLEGVEFDHSFYERHLKGDSYLLYFGDLSRTKGVDLLAPMIPQVLTRHPALKFVLIGRDLGLPGGQKVFDFVAKACEAWKHKLFFHPPLPKSQLYPVIAKASGVLMPSRVDNLPNACLEAQALGIPVVGTDDSSLEEMITDGKTGFLARNGDWANIYETTERLLGQTQSARLEMRERILANVAKAKAEDRVGQLVDFYQQTITNWRGKAQHLV